jgi:DNA mismatch repair ATPase MutS
LVSIFFENHLFGQILSEKIAKLKDIERALQKVHLNIATYSEISLIISGLRDTGSIQEELRKISIASKDDKANRILARIIAKIGQGTSDLVESYQNLFMDPQRESGINGGIGQGMCSKIDQLHKQLIELNEKKRERADKLYGVLGSDILYKEVKCTLAFDARMGPVVELGRLSSKRLDKIHQIIENDKFLSLSNISNRLDTLKFEDKVLRH